jgi:hypothetical protein
MRLPTRNESGSLPMAMLLIMVGTSIGGLIAASSASRVASVKHSSQRQVLLAAAQTGLEVAVAQIRGATLSKRINLPCGPTTGTVGTASRVKYTVTIAYKTVGGAVWSCSLKAASLAPPAYADLSSTGYDPKATGQRTLTARYTVRSLTNPNIAGGLVRMTNTIPAVLGKTPCFDAGSANPAAGTPVQLTQCVSGSKQQTFAYNARIQLVLVSSYSDLLPNGMCVDGGLLPHPNSTVTVTMQPCLTLAYGQQQWSVNDNNNYEGTSDGINLDAHCLNPNSTTSLPTTVVVKKSCSNEWNPEAGVGAGAAGAATSQLVNYNQFGRCFDVPDYTWNNAYMWIWPCKQAPTTAGLTWNQKWDLPDSGTSDYMINHPCTPVATSTGSTCKSTPPAGNNACLKSTLTTGTASFVTLAACPTGTASGAFKWTAYGDTGIYKTSYTIVDSAGNCLTASDYTTSAGQLIKYGHTVGRGITLPCDGGTLQKWNAEPDALKPSPLTLVTEQ